MKLQSAFFGVALIFIAACKVNKNKQSQYRQNQILLDEILVQAKNTQPPYQRSETKFADLLHTRLQLSFNWEKQLVYGKATLTIKPYDLKKIQSVSIDAKQFIINKVGIIQKTDTLALHFTYDNKKLQVWLNQTYHDCDTFKIFIDYIAQPNKIENENKNKHAITDSKGLYFINPLGKDPNKPKQIWTQGETTFNSCWFPTFDRPDEKHTHEIAITVDDKYTTLSNGDLIYSNYHANGTRTDYWHQTMPHAPYLTMIAVGEFAVVKDTRNKNLDINYYVEPKYKPYAKTIFGNTPEMIDFFSKVTGVPFPWSKYSQIVVRDFVSGAMENTTAVVHYEGVAHTDREHEDYDADDIIAHELFHHWFGNLVTCKNWSNLPLNESFATYGEYLWHEHKYGKHYADFMFTKNLEYYLLSKQKHLVKPIRYYYHNPVEVFDVVSYQKGSRILHLLRNQIGDEAFFKGIQLYLTQHKFGSADIHHLRHAMETASGTDLNLFFEQWFMQAGHPEIKVNYQFYPNEMKVIVRQKPTDSTARAYEAFIKLQWGLFTNSNVTVFDTTVFISNDVDTLYITLNQKPAFAVFDADAVLPAKITEIKSEQFWLNQLLYASNYAVKKQAAQMVSWFKDSLNILDAIAYCIKHKDWFMNELAYNMLENNLDFIRLFENEIYHQAQYHDKASCRSSALNLIGTLKKPAYQKIFINALKDKSYNVVSTALYNLLTFDTALVIKAAEKLEQETNGIISVTLAEIYTDLGLEHKNNYFIQNLGKQGLYRNEFIDRYITYLKNQNFNNLKTGIEALIHYKNQTSDNDINYNAKKWAKRLRAATDNNFPKQEREVLNKLFDMLEEEI